MSDWEEDEGVATRGWGIAGWRGYGEGRYLAENPGSRLSDIKRWHRAVGAVLGIAIAVPIVIRKVIRRR